MSGRVQCSASFGNSICLSCTHRPSHPSSRAARKNSTNGAGTPTTATAHIGRSQPSWATPRQHASMTVEVRANDFASVVNLWRSPLERANREATSMPTAAPARRPHSAPPGRNTAGKPTELPDLIGLFEALRKPTGGGGRQLNVPVADPDLRTSKGSAVKWDDRRARALFTALRQDRPAG